MENIDLQLLAFLLGSGFIAAFIDSVVGGGGLVSVPALMLTGLPPTIVLGTNKLAGTMSSLTSTLSFIASGKVNLKLVKFLFPLAFFGSVAGAYTIKQIPSEFLKPLVVVLLALVALYTIFKRDWGQQSNYRGISSKRVMALTAAAALILGFYDGFFGPGAGSFLIFAFIALGCDFVQAAGNAKVLNFASNIAAILTFAWLDSVNYYFGLVMGAGMILGALVGSRVAIAKGAAYVRPMFLSITLLMIGKQLWDIFR